MTAKPGSEEITFLDANEKPLSTIKVNSPNSLFAVACWKPDSTEFLYRDKDELHVVNIFSGKSKTLSGLHPQFMMPSWSPNSKLIACLGSFPEPGRQLNTLKIWDASGKEVAAYADQLGNRLVWSPDSKSIALIDNEWLVKIYDIASNKITASIQAERAGLPLVTWSPDSKYITVGSGMSGEVNIHDSSTGEFITSHQYDHKGALDIEWGKDGSALKVQRDFAGQDWESWTVPYDAKSHSIQKTKQIEKKLGMKGYIPANLDECFVQLEAELPKDKIEKISSGTESDLIGYHLGLGMYLRNSWGLWSGSRLAKYFKQQGLFHPDDMSGVILKSYWRHKNAKPLELEQQIEFYKAYWIKAKADQEAAEVQARENADNAQKLMMNLQFVDTQCPTISFDELKGRGIEVCYAANLSQDVIFITEKHHVMRKLQDGNSVMNDEETGCLIFDRKARKLSRIKTQELERIDNGIVIDGTIYLSGTSKNKPAVLKISKSERKLLPLPIPDRWNPEEYRQRESSQYQALSFIDPRTKSAITPDLSQDGWNVLGHGKDQILLVQPKTVYELQNNSWVKLFTTTKLLPKSFSPPIMDGTRIYFMEDGSALCWVDKAEPDKLIFAIDDINHKKSNFPKGIFAQTFSWTEDGSFWLTSGIFNQISVIKWTKSSGYQIPISSNASLNPLDAPSSTTIEKKQPASHIILSSIFAKDGDTAIGANTEGLLKIDTKTITPLVKFKIAESKPVIDKKTGSISMRPSWAPHFIFMPDDHSYLLGGAFAGCYLLTNTNGSWSMEQIDAETPQEKSL